MSDGRTLGVFCGLLLFGFFGYALKICLGSVLSDPGPGFTRALKWLFAIAVIKFAALPLVRGNFYDVMCWNLWAAGIARVGPARIYAVDLFGAKFQCNYPPGYLYVLWPLGALAQALGLKSYDSVRLLTEAPPLIGDLLLGLAIFATLRRLKSPALASQGTILLATNAALIFDSLFWGQNDSVLTLAILMSVLLIADARFALGWGMAALTVLIKPQGFFLLPVLALFTLLEGGWRDWVGSALAFGAAFALGFAPFQIGHPWSWVFHVYGLSVGKFRVTSDNAFNLLGLLGGLRQPDSKSIVGVPAFWLGMGMLAGVYVLAGWLLWRRRNLHALTLAAQLAYLGLFVLGPRIHERYLYVAVVLAVPLMFDSWTAYGAYRVLTVTLLINLAYVQATLMRLTGLAPHNPIAGAVALANLAVLAGVVVQAVLEASPDLADRRLPPRLRPLFRPPRIAARYEATLGAAG